MEKLFIKSIHLYKNGMVYLNYYTGQSMKKLEDLHFKEFIIINGLMPTRELPLKWDKKCIDLAKKFDEQ